MNVACSSVCAVSLRKSFRMLLLCTLFVICGTSGGAEFFGRAPKPADAVMLDGKWDVFLTDNSRVEPPYPADGKALTVNINSQTSHDTQGWSGLKEQFNHAWYSKKISLPSTWQGRRILLAVNRCRWESRVFLNGRAVGIYTGMSPFIFDVTDAAKPGAENELLIVASGIVAFLKDRDKDLERLTAAEKQAFFSNYAFQMTSPKLEDRWLYRLIDYEGGYKLGLQGGWFYSEDAVYLPDTFVKTSVSKENLTADVTARNKSGSDVECMLSGRVLDADGRTVLEIPGRQVQLKAGCDTELTMSQQWRNPRLWDTNDPYMYTLVCELTQNGKIIAARNTEFGFREFRTEGDQYVLNGKRIHLFTNFYIYDPAAYFKSGEMQRLGFNSLLLCGGRPPHYSMDTIDRNGILVGLDTQVQFETGRQVDKKDPRYWEMFKNDFDSMVRQYRNHPAIVKWGMSNEYYITGDQNSIKHFSEMKDYLRSRLDDTRPYVCRGDWLPDIVDIRSIHGAPHADYPNSNGFGNVKARQVSLIPNNGYLWKTLPMLVSKSTGLGEELIPADKPVMLDENAYLFWMRSMDPLTVLDGEKVYSESTLNSVEDMQRGFVGLEHPKNIVAVRFRSTVAGWIFQANRLNQIAEFAPHGYGVNNSPEYKERNQQYQAMYDNIFAPVALYLHTFSRHYYDNEKAVFDLSVHNDTRLKKNLTLQWEIGGRKAGESSFELEPGTMKTVAAPLELVSRPVGQRTAVEIAFRLLDAGKEVKTISNIVEVFPAKTDKINWSGAQLLVFDPSGVLGRALGSRGVEYTSVKDLKNLENPAGGATLMVAPETLADQGPLTGKALLKFAGAGGRVVILRQRDTPNWIPARMPLLDNSTDSTIAFIAAPLSPLFKDLKNDDFKFWRGDSRKLLDWNVVSLNNYIIPCSGNFVPLLTAGGPEGLVYSPMIEFFIGKGSIIGCQVLLTEKLGREPAADILFRNLLNYAMSKDTGRTLESAGLIAGNDKNGAELFRQAGLATAQVSPSAAGSSGQPVIFVHADALNSIEPAALRQRLDAGGTIFVYGISMPEQVKALAAQSGLTLAADKFTRNDLPLSKTAAWAENPLMQGVNNGMFFWTRDVSMATGGGENAAMKFAYDRTIADVVLSNASGDNLIGHGANSVMTAAKAGTGRLILCTIRWDKPLTLDASIRTMRLLSVLATNLGIKVDPSGGVPPVNPANTFQVDLRRFVNMGFADDAADNGKGGWTDEGSANDMRGMPVGMQFFTDRAIPFDVIDPVRNDGKSVLLLGSKTNSLPQHVNSIPVGRKAAKLYFLQTCAWSGESAKYVVHYADKSTAEIPVVNEVNIGNWWFNKPLPDALLVPVVNTYHMYKTEGTADLLEVKSTRYISCFAWNNPQPEKVIEAIDFETDARQTRFVLVAITGQTEPDKPASQVSINKTGNVFKIQNSSAMTLTAGDINIDFGIEKNKPIYHVLPFITVLGKEYYASYANRKSEVKGELRDGMWRGTQQVEFDVEGGTVVPLKIIHEMTDSAGDLVNITWTQPDGLQARKGHVGLAQIMYWDVENGAALFSLSDGRNGDFRSSALFGQIIRASEKPAVPSFVFTTTRGEKVNLYLQPGTSYKFSTITGKGPTQPAMSAVMYLYPPARIETAKYNEPLTWWFRVDCEPAGKR